MWCLILLVAVWFGCGFLGSHIGHTSLNRMYPAVSRDRWQVDDYLLTIAGPINLFVCLFVCLCLYGLTRPKLNTHTNKYITVRGYGFRLWFHPKMWRVGRYGQTLDLGPLTIYKGVK